MKQEGGQKNPMIYSSLAESVMLCQNPAVKYWRGKNSVPVMILVQISVVTMFLPCM
jgi:hypothetical protein